MTTTFKQFQDKNLGKYIDVDNFPLADKSQCVDVFRAYMRDVLGIGMYEIPTGRGAIDIYNKHPWETKYFKKVKNTPTGVPKPGSIIFLHSNVPGWTGWAGHVGLVVNANVFRTIWYHQNYPSSSTPCVYREFPYKVWKNTKELIIGWLEPKIPVK